MICSGKSYIIAEPIPPHHADAQALPPPPRNSPAANHKLQFKATAPGTCSQGPFLTWELDACSVLVHVKGSPSPQSAFSSASLCFSNRHVNSLVQGECAQLFSHTVAYSNLKESVLLLNHACIIGQTSTEGNSPTELFGSQLLVFCYTLCSTETFRNTKMLF